MKCQNCQYDNRENAKFCKKCGTKLELVCPACGYPVEPDSIFCDECGHNLSNQESVQNSTESFQSIPAEPITDKTQPLPEGERRRATIVFSDLSGYTSMNEELDPEEVEAIMSRTKQEAVRIVERHGGIVNQFVGDEVLALFGIPTANEDDPIRAIRAARPGQRQAS